MRTTRLRRDEIVTPIGVKRKNNITLDFSLDEANKIIDIEDKILEKMNYVGGGYYENQKQNHNIYLVVRKAMMNLPKLDEEYYNYFEEGNYHSLNAVLKDLGKL